MATKPNPAPLPAGEAENTEPKAAPSKRSLIGRLFGVFAVLNPLTFLKLPLMKKLIVVTALVVVIGGGGGAYYFLGLSAGEENADGAPGEAHAPASDLPPATAAFFDVPDMVVNIQTADATPAYLKLAVSLELDNEEAKAAIEPVMPRVVDQFQTYLRELRVEDVRGSMGVMRLKEELLRRVNLAVAPTPVRDVLLKEMIVQ
jgi:flagellar protein FliL